MARSRRSRGGRGKTSGPTRRADFKWLIRYHDGGKRRQLLLDADVSEEQARRIHREKLGTAVGKSSGVIPNLTFGELVGKWREAKDAEFSPAWRYNLDSLLENHLLTKPRRDSAGRRVLDANGDAILDPVLRDRVVETFTPADFDAYVASRRAEGAAPSTINKETGSALQAALNWAEVRAKIIRVNPIKGLERLTENQRTDFFTMEEWTAFSTVFEDPARWIADRSKVRKLGPLIVDPRKGTERRHGGGRKPAGEASMKQLERHRKAMDVFRACLLTGSRIGEVESLTWDAVDLKGGRVTIRQSKTRKKVGNSDKVLELSPEHRALFEKQGKGIGKALVFQRPGGGKWERAQLSRVFERAKDLSGVRPELTIHTLRHTAASWLTQDGVDSRKVGEILGHRDPRSTARYSHLAPEHTADAVARLGRMAGAAVRRVSRPSGR